MEVVDVKGVWAVILFVLYMATTDANSYPHRRRIKRAVGTSTTTTLTSSTLSKTAVTITLVTQRLQVTPASNSSADTTEGNATLSSDQSTSSHSVSVARTTAPLQVDSIDWIIGLSVGGSVIIVLIVVFVRICCRYCASRDRKASLPVFPAENDSSIHDGGSENYGSQANLHIKDDRQSVQYHAENRRPTDQFRF